VEALQERQTSNWQDAFKQRSSSAHPATVHYLGAQAVTTTTRVAPTLPVSKADIQVLPSLPAQTATASQEVSLGSSSGKLASPLEVILSSNMGNSTPSKATLSNHTDMVNPAMVHSLDTVAIHREAMEAVTRSHPDEEGGLVQVEQRHLVLAVAC
jgi:hypothetical protein